MGEALHMTPAVRRGGSASHVCPRGHRHRLWSVVHSDPGAEMTARLRSWTTVKGSMTASGQTLDVRCVQAFPPPPVTSTHRHFEPRSSSLSFRAAEQWDAQRGTDDRREATEPCLELGCGGRLRVLEETG